MEIVGFETMTLEGVLLEKDSEIDDEFCFSLENTDISDLC